MATPPVIELNWAGFVTKKSSKTEDKQSWKRRWLVLDAATMTLTWSDGEGRPAKNLLVLDAAEMTLEDTTEHDREFEFVITARTGGTRFFVCFANTGDAEAFRSAVEAARRQLVCARRATGMYVLSSKKEEEFPTAVQTRGEDAKVFAWGIDTCLGVGEAGPAACAVPLRVGAETLRGDAAPRLVAMGPEHVGAVSVTGDGHLWGSNEFEKVGVPPGLTVAKAPLLLFVVKPRRVLALACGGSHTLATVADEGEVAGRVVVWGTGHVGQLGLGEETIKVDKPTDVNFPGDAPPTAFSKVFAGFVTSAALATTGELYVWGDASIGRLGLPSTPDTTLPDKMPRLLNARIVWEPKLLKISARDCGVSEETVLTVIDVGLGGSFSMFLVHVGAGRGCVLLISGALGVDVTRDMYGYPETENDADICRQIQDEIKRVPRYSLLQPVHPFGRQPVVLAICAGTRHAAAIVAEDVAGGAPRLYTAGKGWLGHTGTVMSRKLQPPVVSTVFSQVVGTMEHMDVVEVACGHSHTIVRTADHKLYAWGRGDSGELGTGNFSDFSLPVEGCPVSDHTWVQACAGSYSSCAVATPGVTPPLNFSDVLVRYQQRYHETVEEQEAARAAIAQPEEEDPLPDGWDYRYDDDGNVVFICPHAEETYDDPREYEQPVDCWHHD